VTGRGTPVARGDPRSPLRGGTQRRPGLSIPVWSGPPCCHGEREGRYVTLSDGRSPRV